ncbi:MAG TPA: hypothetical protein DEG17_19650 [Cyanobacteria bacterium UBA11149]|nr:hypothetical protein [Cyanobacteria bacterium UBA11367]HBE56266.1 hypothetical protein [Cyanobacteria bacterium UBA11366]HBK64622.1 hypothetical protein [Cyanobacteria bacterium UBA11166]HBR76185.1 hypothetical protein [Cyanobacteria bacterium UBA11159]HBS68153.1 hypothetical protein [Cyanobacteria bacterium UBA11153]HBW91015.1 hypothetical protein [Cyanobacteria bacterium UBA11149]HCA95302.1 hypothetical protein [Cyanobacteria bacterium UBA9226]
MSYWLLCHFWSKSILINQNKKTISLDKIRVNAIAHNQEIQSKLTIENREWVRKNEEWEITANN